MLAIFAGENKTLAKLAVDSNQALAPFAAVRERVADFIVQSNTVATATAKHRGALAKQLRRLPGVPAPARAGGGTDRPVRRSDDPGVHRPQSRGARDQQDLHQPAGVREQLHRVLHEPRQDRPAISGPAIAATQPLLDRVQALGKALKPFAGNFSELLSSLRSTGGLERFLDFIFLSGGSLNGYDSLGHFLRAEILGKNCVGYKVAPQSGCSANFIKTEGSAASSASTAAASPTSLVMDRTLAVLNGATPAAAIAKYPGTVPRLGASNGALASLGVRRRGRHHRQTGRVARARAPPTTRPRAKARAPAGCCSTTCSGN